MDPNTFTGIILPLMFFDFFHTFMKILILFLIFSEMLLIGFQYSPVYSIPYLSMIIAALPVSYDHLALHNAHALHSCLPLSLLDSLIGYSTDQNLVYLLLLCELQFAVPARIPV
jgi:hypothetical protein